MGQNVSLLRVCLGLKNSLGPRDPKRIESVKGSRNSAFLQKDQLCYLKRAEKLTFCIYFYRTTCKIVTFFVNASRSDEKLKKGTFLEKKAGI